LDLATALQFILQHALLALNLLLGELRLELLSAAFLAFLLS